MVRRQPVWVSATVLALGLMVTAQVSAVQPTRVLLIHSFGNSTPPARAISAAFEEELGAKMSVPLDVDQVSLDMGRYADREMQEAIVDFLQKRQAKWQPDLVVTMGAPAATFVASHRDLFPEAPVIYASLDRRLLPPGALEKNAAYVGQVFNAPGWIEDILQIAPATKNIEVVVGATPLERGWKDTFQKAAEPFAGRLKFTYYDDLSFEQMRERVAKLPRDSYIFLLLLRRDALGAAFDADDVLRRLHEVANAPINSVFREQLGLGIVGGRLYQSSRIGKEAADVASRILHGEPASNLPPIQVDPSPPHYDWRELHRWKIDEKLLPPGSTVLYRMPTFWERHRLLVIAGITLFVVQALLIAGLLANLFRRRRAEGSLIESEQRFQTMANAAPIMIWMTGPDKSCTFLNKVWLDFRGRALEQEIGFGWKEGIHPDDLEELLRVYETAFDAREPFVVQFRLHRKDGEYRAMTGEGIPRYGASGRFRGYVGVALDITDALQKEEALHEWEERTSLAAEAAHLGVWERDLVTQTFWISDKARELFGFGPSESVTYEMFRARIHPEDLALSDLVRSQAIATKGGYELEYRILDQDGKVRWMSGRARSILDENGRVARLLGVVMDITERKLVAEQARKNREEIDRLMRISLLGEMTGSIAHELNQPLSGILSNASAGQRFIDRGNVDTGMIREILTDIAADGRRASDVISHIRNTIKKGAAIRERINLNEVITRVAHMVQPDLVAHSCELQLSLGDGLPEVEGDPIQIQQVLINLVKNAFDAMRDVPVPERKVRLETENGDSTVKVKVADRGTGISDEIHPRLFDQFVTTKEEGLGMGLAIVRSIIEAHGGSIEAENIKEGGACFFFSLPVANGLTNDK